MTIKKALLFLAIGGLVGFYLGVLTEQNSANAEPKMTKDEAAMEILRQLNETQ